MGRLSHKINEQILMKDFCLKKGIVMPMQLMKEFIQKEIK